MGSVEGRIALVTGGGRGVGRGISELLASEGATVAVNYVRDEDSARDTVRTIEAAGGTAQLLQGSTADPEDCERLAAEVAEAFGGIDILVCNAGIASRGRSVADTDAEEGWKLVATHAMGPHQLCRQLQGEGDDLPRPVALPAHLDGHDDPIARHGLSYAATSLMR